MKRPWRLFSGNKSQRPGAYLPLGQQADPSSDTSHPGRWLWKTLENYKLSLILSILCIILILDRFYGVLGQREQGGGHLQLSQRMLPHIPTRLVTFLEDKSFMDGIPGDPNQPWETLVPEGRGFIKIPEPEKWDLSGGFPLNGSVPYSEQYCISMFHQLHCVATLKTAFAKLLRREQQGMQHDAPNEHEEASSQDDAHHPHLASHLDHLTNPTHLDHCFDYLRQAIMCAGDMTLEKAHVVEGQVSNAVNGWGVEHECRDWRTMYDYATQNRVKSTNGILNAGE